VIVNVHANRSWTAHNNELLAQWHAKAGNTWLIDWNSLALQCPGSCFAADGIHLNAAGAKYFADKIGDITGK
jgi:lysophospholipase L1-like esterase